jgi:hypothetical protein
MDQTSQFMTLHDASRNVSTPARSHSASLQLVSTCSEPLAADRARILFGCYRRGDAEDREIYVGAVCAILASYPEAVARRVTDPRTGLPGTSHYLPTVADVRAACEREMEPVRAEHRRKLQRQRNQAIFGGKINVSAERRKALADELRQRLAQHGNAMAAEWTQRPPMVSESLAASLARQPEPQHRLG